MTPDVASRRHAHVFLGEAHRQNELNVWAVIALCGAMMVAEIVGGALFGSIALVADGFHMSTHAGALTLAALAYTFARQRAADPKFTFGTGKFGDLAGFSSALILAMIALGIAFESAERFFAPRPIAFAEAIPIAVLGLVVNVASAWLLSRGGHDHGHSHGHSHGEEARRLAIGGALWSLSIFEEGTPPRFRLARVGAAPGADANVEVETIRATGERRRFAMANRGGFWESIDAIPEPHAFEAHACVGEAVAVCRFDEGAHAVADDHNLRAALLHVLADAAVSAIVIVGLTLAMLFGWLWMDPLAGLIGAGVIASWSHQLIRDTARALLDVNPDPDLSAALSRAVEGLGDELVDVHLWRLGPGHLGAILAVETGSAREADDYRTLVSSLAKFSHLTIEIARRSAAPNERRRVA